MPKLIAAPTIVAAAGTKPKKIEEFAGRVNSGHASVSIARMTSPSGWEEPGQRPEFEEITVVLRGTVRVEHEDGVFEVRAGQAVVTAPGEWVRYSTPGADGAEYIAVCLPAFSPATVHRDANLCPGQQIGTLSSLLKTLLVESFLYHAISVGVQDVINQNGVIARGIGHAGNHEAKLSA